MVDTHGVSFKDRKVPLRLNYSKYGGLLTEDNLIRLAALLIDYSTDELLFEMRNIVLVNPEIKVRVSPARETTAVFFVSFGKAVVSLHRSSGSRKRNERWLRRSH